MPSNLPTLLTWARVVAIPLLVGVFFLPVTTFTQNLLATVLFVGAAITDWLDGWLARRYGWRCCRAPPSRSTGQARRR